MADENKELNTTNNAETANAEIRQGTPEEFKAIMNKAVKEGRGAIIPAEEVEAIRADIRRNGGSEQTDEQKEIYLKLLQAANEKLLHELELQSIALREEIKKPEYQGKTLEELEKEGSTEDDRIIKGSLYEKALIAAAESIKKQLNPRKRGKHPAKVNQLVLDKTAITKEIVGTHYEISNTFQNMSGATEYKSNNSFVNVNNALDLKNTFYFVSKEALPDFLIDYYDLQMFSSLQAEFRQGNKKISGTRLLRTMNCEKDYGVDYSATSEQLKTLYEHLVKCSLISLTINNKEEAIKYGKEGYKSKYGTLANVEIDADRSVKTDEITSFDITINDEPLLLKNAISRREFFVVPMELFKSKLKLTSLNIGIKLYVLEAILLEIQKGKTNNIHRTYKNLYERIGADTRQKQRTAKANLFIYLEELKSRNYNGKPLISDYADVKLKSGNGFRIKIAKQQLAITKNSDS